VHTLEISQPDWQRIFGVRIHHDQRPHQIHP